MGLLDYVWGDTEDQKEARLAATPFKTKNRTCTDLGCLLLYIIALLGWIAVTILAVMDGDPEKILYPTDSAGNICGKGEQADLPMMFMFDITRCAGIGKALHGCPTPSICVKQCPDLDWSYQEGKLEEVRQYCYKMTDREWQTESLEDLVEMRLCPAYLVKQKPLFDRCLPSFVNGDDHNVTEEEEEDLFLTSLHDGTSSNDSIAFLGQSTLINSIHGYVKKLVGTSNENTTLGREKRTITDITEVNSDVFTNDEYNEVNSNSTEFLYDDGNTTKRDLSVIFDVDTLREGADELKRILDLKSLSERLLWDLSQYWWILLSFLFVAFLLSFLWIGLLNCCAVAAVWLTILATTLCLCTGLAVYSITEYQSLSRAGPQQDDIFLTSVERITTAVTNNQYFWLSLSVVFTFLACLLTLLLCCCFKRISIATDMIGEASQAIREISCSLVFPLFPALLHLVLVCWFLTTGAFLLSSRVEQYHVINGCEEENCTGPGGEVYRTWDSCQPDTFANCSTCPDSSCVFHRYGPRTLHTVLQWYNIFVFLWSVGLVSGMADMTLAGAVANWYWTFKKETDLPSNILRNSFKRTLRYHLGTVACGSFVLAVAQLARLSVEYLNDKIQRANANNSVVKAIVYCLRGCFFFLEKLIKYINRNAFVMTAMVGSGFWKSSKDAFHLITTNIVRGLFVNQVTDFVMILGKIFVIGISSVCFALAINDPRLEIHFNIIPILLIIFGSYHIANTCFSVYTVAVDTLFLCFLKDIEQNDGGWRKPYYMSKRLMKIMRYENI